MSITLKDIARSLGISTSTVSKAINNRPGVSPELQNKIFQAMKRNNFRPKQQVGGLIEDDSININLLVRINKAAENDPFYSLITEGISQELQAHKGNLLYHVLHENKMNETVFEKIFEFKKIDGNIFVGADFDNNFIDKINNLGNPTVLVDNINPEFSSVNTDNLKGAVDAIEHLTKFKHRDIIFLSGPLNHKSIYERFEGYQKGLRKFMKNPKPKVVECQGVSVNDGYEAINNYKNTDFTAIFASTDKLAIGAIKALKEKSLQIPEDISIIGFDDIEWGVHTEPSLSTISVAKYQIGFLAAQHLMNLINKKDMYPVNLRVATELVKRDSTGLAPQR